MKKNYFHPVAALVWLNLIAANNLLYEIQDKFNYAVTHLGSINTFVILFQLFDISHANEAICCENPKKCNC